MKKLSRLVIIVAMFISVSGFGQEHLTKITVTEDNNPVLNDRYALLNIPDSIDTADYLELREFVDNHFKAKSLNEPEIFFELMGWVSKQWKHNGWNAAPDTMNSLGILKTAINEGEQYRCVEYGRVLKDVLLAYGYISRSVRLKHIDVDYGGAGMGHVATEVWSNQFEKWIFLDPQFNIYARFENTPLNIFDISELKKKGKFDEIEFVTPGEKKENFKYGSDFLTNYLGYIDIQQEKNQHNYLIALKLAGKRNFLTFQAFPYGRTVFTNDSEELYYSLNQTMMILDYSEAEQKRVKEAYAKLNIKSSEGFNKNMYLFSAKPDFKLSLDNNMPWFDKYIVKLNGQAINPESSVYSISLKKGLNTIDAVAINKAGVKGVPTQMKIMYE